MEENFAGSSALDILGTSDMPAERSLAGAA
jgi:hypothetical protein